MTTTPVEIRHLRFGRAFRGYQREAVDDALETIASSFERVWGDRGELADKTERLEKEVERLRELEDVLKNTLIAAERSAADALERAKRQADLVVEEAHAEARTITREAQAERERLLKEVRRLKALLRSALELTEEPAPGDEGWPNREEPADVRPLPNGERERRSA